MLLTSCDPVNAHRDYYLLASTCRGSMPVFGMTSHLRQGKKFHSYSTRASSTGLFYDSAHLFDFAKAYQKARTFLHFGSFRALLSATSLR
jgi:hypothetical protein